MIARDIWLNLYDISLEKVTEEKECLRAVSMLIHVLQKEFHKLKTFVNNFPEEKCDKLNEITSSNINGETICLEESSDREDRTFDLSLSGHNTPDKSVKTIPIKEQDETKCFVEDTFIEQGIFKSPKLNKRKHLKKVMKHKIRRNLLSPTKLLNRSTSVVTENQTKKTKRNNEISRLKPLDISSSNDKNKSNISLNTAILDTFEEFDLNESDDISNRDEKGNNSNIDNDVTIIPDSPVLEKGILKGKSINISTNIDNEITQLPNQSLKSIPEKSKISKENLQVENSFDWFHERKLPEDKNAVKNKESEVVCDICQEFFGCSTSKFGLKCLHKRKKYKTDIFTPPGFWNPDFSPTQNP